MAIAILFMHALDNIHKLELENNTLPFVWSSSGIN